MTGTTRLLYFGDQRSDVSSRIKILHREARNSLALSCFLQDASSVIRTLFEGLSSEERGPYAQFETIVELMEALDEHGTPNELVSSVLFFAALFGDLVL
jgi:hypothetical protein